MEQARCTWCRALSSAPQIRSSLTYTFPFPFPIAHVSFGLSEAFAQLFTKHLWRLIDRYRASLHAWVLNELNNGLVRFDCLHASKSEGFLSFRAPIIFSFLFVG